MSMSAMNKAISENTSLIYDLYGVVNHFGSMSFGHYTAYCKNNDKWFLYDDDSIIEVENLEEIVSDAAYVLFYKKKL